MKKIKSIEEIKYIEFEVMKYVNQTCKRLGINCYLSGGTLLGAIRHKGFIPWDDDIDMMLFRNDYNKLIKELEEEKNNPYKVLTYKTDAQYYYPFAKVIDTRTKLIENVKIPIKNAGIGIDLFPIDGLPQNKRFRLWYFVQMQNLRNIFDSLYEISYKINSNELLIWINRKILRVLARMIDGYAALHKSGHSKLVAVSVWGYGKKETISKQKMEKSIEIEFELENFTGPIGYDTYLSNLYGDYMKLPPKSKRHSEHNASAWHKG